MMPPIVSIVGKANVGKTTLLERLVGELKRRGYRVATIKHIAQGFDLDIPGKDSWRLAQAGSDAVVISSAQKLALIKRVEQASSLEELSHLVGADFDIILTEGFRGGDAPKIEVHREQLGAELLCSPQQLFAIASDEPLGLGVRQYSLDDIQGLADLIEQSFLSQQEEEDVALMVNRRPVPLNPFVKEFIAKVLLGMVSVLKGAEEVESLNIWLRRKI